MTTRWCFAGVLAVGLAAHLALAVPLQAVVAVTILACTVRHPAVLVCAVVVWTSWWSSQSWTKLDSRLPARVVGVAKLTTDPEQRRFATEADVIVAKRRWRAAFDGTCSDARTALAGETIAIEATVAPLTGRGAPAARRRHLAGRLSVTKCGQPRAAKGLDALSNAIRRVTDRGIRQLATDERALVKGLVFGDAREQSPIMRARFAQSGLTHLLVVSGANVTFVLFAVGAFLQRMPVRRRTLVLVLVMVVFGTLTRWQPSVLRALTMVGITTLGELSGRPIDRGRRLCLAVVVLLAIDPFLIGSIGFLLSAGACAGLVVVFGPVRRRIHRGGIAGDALAATVAAQTGALPVSALLFGVPDPISVVTNVMAAPVAAVLSTWVTVVAIPAGALGAPVAVPAGVITGTLASALLRIAALAESEILFALLLLMSAVGALAYRHRVAAVMVVALGGWTLLPQSAPERCFDGDVILVTTAHDVTKAAECLRRSSKRQVPILVVTDDAALADAQSVIPAQLVLARRAGPTIDVGDRYRAGSHLVSVNAVEPRLRVTVEPLRSRHV